MTEVWKGRGHRAAQTPLGQEDEGDAMSIEDSGGEGVEFNVIKSMRSAEKNWD